MSATTQMKSGTSSDINSQAFKQTLIQKCNFSVEHFGYPLELPCHYDLACLH
jgi:hypothetical protein